MEINDKVPDFCLPDHAGIRRCLSDFRDKWIIIHFYPKDNTSGCTREAIDFNALFDDFEKRNAVIIGISPDSVASHQKFTEKHGFRMFLLSDEQHSVAESYGVWRLKRSYDREFYGIGRSTFLITPRGSAAHIWRKVKVDGHVDEVKRTLATLQQ